MTTPMLLGINGKRRSGKDTTASILTDWCSGPTKLNFTSRRMGLADDMKKSGLAALGAFKHFINPEAPMEAWMHIANTLKENGTITIDIPEVGQWTITGLEFWQLFGTEAHRDIFAQDFWVNNLLPRDEVQLYRKWMQPDNHTLTQLMMVTDVRFPNEAERVKELGGFVLRIERPEAEIEVKHSSENGLPEHMVDETIVNDEGLDEFEAKVRQFAFNRLHYGLVTGSGIWGEGTHLDR